MSEAFLDTAFAVAASVPTDAFHARAVQLAAKIKADRTRLITTRGVMMEIGNALSKPRYRAAATTLL